MNRKPFGANQSVKTKMYYLVTDYSIPVYIECDGMSHIADHVPFGDKRRYYVNRAGNLPRNYTIARLDDHTQVHAVFFNIDKGLFLIKANNQRVAYEAVRALDGFFFLMAGDTPCGDVGLPHLIEISHVPQSNWKPKRLFEELSQRNIEVVETDVNKLGLVRFIQKHEVESLGPCTEKIYSDRRLNEALHHLGYSRFLCYGFMVGSYYDCHYRHDRNNMSRHLIQKQYFENRERYELAFLSAFRGIERFLNVNQIKHPNIDKALMKLQTADVTPDTKYRRRHEIFSGHTRYISYRDIIARFLDIRNVVAAHANPSPPRNFVISEDSVIEVQLFLSELCCKALGQIQPRELPSKAVLPLYTEKHSAQHPRGNGLMKIDQ